MGFFVQVPPSASTAGDWTALKGWLTGILVLRGAYYSTDHNGADWLAQQLTSLCLGAAGCIHSRVLLVMPMAGGVETRGSPRLVVYGYMLAVTSQAPGHVPGHGRVHGGEHLKRGDAPCTAQQSRSESESESESEAR